MSAIVKSISSADPALPVCLSPWLENPYRLVSLWDMLRAYAEKFVRAAHYISTIEWTAMSYATAKTGGPENALQREAVTGRLKHEMLILKQECDRLGLLSTSAHLDRFLPMPGYTHDVLVNFMQDISLRFQEDLAKELFVQVPSVRAKLYENPLEGWGIVVDRVGCKFDIVEAGICLSLDRNTASVFHLMGVIQACLNALARSLKTKVDLDTATWNTIIEKMEQGITAKRLATKSRSKWKKDLEPFYAEAISDIRALKNAWRNPTLHFWRSATEAEARKVYDRTRDFALLIASGPVKLKPVP